MTPKNTASNFIKSKLLSEPAFYPSRWSVLEDVLLGTHAKYQWGEAGTVLECGPVGTGARAMYVGDLDAKLDELAGYLASTPPESCFYPLVYRYVAREQVSLGFERTARRYRELHLDHYAGGYAEEPIENFDYSKLAFIDWENCLLGNIPFNVSPDWEAVCLGVLTAMKGLGVAYYSRTAPSFVPFDRVSESFSRIQRLIALVD